MNLLTDSWIPVLLNGRQQRIGLKTLLTQDSDYEIGLARDDMELACLSMLVNLVQVVFQPDNIAGLKAQRKQAMSSAIYDESIDKFKDWFDLEHPDTPFMQTRCQQHDIPTVSTPIQKLFAGLPTGGNSHSFFNDIDQIEQVCASCAALALFNQASNAPNFSGKHKGGLKSTAMTTLVTNGNLRQRVWANVLTAESVTAYMLDEGEQAPVWLKPHTDFGKLKSWIRKKPKPQIVASDIGLARGLFWQPLLIELEKGNDKFECCDHCGMADNSPGYTGFGCAADFIFDVVGFWQHPQSPIELRIDKGKPVTRYIAYRNNDPAWTQLHRFLYKVELDSGRKEGFRAAPVLSQARKLMRGEHLHLAVGGYHNDQARIIQRRHERYDISEQWADAGNLLPALIQLTAEVKSVLKKRLWAFGLQLDDSLAKQLPKSLSNGGEQRFLQLASSPMRELLINLNGSEALRQRLKKSLMDVADAVFVEQTQQYRHSPKMIKAYALNHSGLRSALQKIP